MWRFVVGKLDCGQLMFVDVRWALIPRLLPCTATRPAVSGRFLQAAEKNRAKNTTLLARSIGREGMGPSMVSWRALY